MQDERVNIPAYQRVNRKARVFRRLILFLKNISYSPDSVDQFLIKIPIDFVTQSTILASTTLVWGSKL